MMRVTGLAYTAVILGAAYMLAPAIQGAGIDRDTTASVKPDVNEYTVSNMENSTACLITRGKAVTVRSREVTAGSDCAAVWPDLTQARNWTQNEDGTVVLSDSRGEQLLTLVQGDGVAFESLEPANAVLALTSVQ
jgi:hypothetical protein